MKNKKKYEYCFHFTPYNQYEECDKCEKNKLIALE